MKRIMNYKMYLSSNSFERRYIRNMVVSYDRVRVNTWRGHWLQTQE